MTVSAATPLPIIVFADGASSGNPGPGGWGAIIVLPEGRVIELGARDPQTTNNKMELMGVIGALLKLESVEGQVDVHTDSTYVIQGITQWIWAWRSRDWKTAEGKDVANVDLWKRLFALVAKRGKQNLVVWKYVRGHSGVPGNERVDEIAVAFSKGNRIDLYQGPLLKYHVAIHDIPEDTKVPIRSKKATEPKAKAFSYLSVVGNTPMRHSTWAECERRVKGQSGAKFKKALSSDEEIKILSTWGYQAKDIKGS